MNQLILAERGVIKPKKRRELEQAGYIVVVVPDIEKVRVAEAAKPPANHEDDGFNLDG